MKYLYVLASVACLLVSACGASLSGTANPPVKECSGQCACHAGCCNLAQIDCAGVLCHESKEDPIVCEFTGDGIGPGDENTNLIGGKKRRVQYREGAPR
ncbi:MAG TPA: hypothetical protein VGI39_01485 [Polyangiaceae bacterium]